MSWRAKKNGVAYNPLAEQIAEFMYPHHPQGGAMHSHPEQPDPEPQPEPTPAPEPEPPDEK